MHGAYYYHEVFSLFLHAKFSCYDDQDGDIKYYHYDDLTHFPRYSNIELRCKTSHTIHTYYLT